MTKTLKQLLEESNGTKQKPEPPTSVSLPTPVQKEIENNDIIKSYSSEDLSSFLNAIKSVEDSFSDVDNLRQVIRTIMTDLAEHPEYEEHLEDEHWHNILKAMTDSLGGAQIQKTGTRKKGKKKKEIIFDGLGDDLAALGDIEL